MWNYFCLLPRTPYLSLPTLPCFPLPSNDACSLVSPTTASTPIPAATIPLAGHSAIPRDSPIAVTDPLLSADAFTNPPTHPPTPPASRHRSHAPTSLIEHRTRRTELNLLRSCRISHLPTIRVRGEHQLSLSLSPFFCFSALDQRHPLAFALTLRIGGNVFSPPPPDRAWLRLSLHEIEDRRRLLLLFSSFFSFLFS